MNEVTKPFKFRFTVDYIFFLLNVKFKETCLEYKKLLVKNKIHIPEISGSENNEDDFSLINDSLGYFLRSLLEVNAYSTSGNSTGEVQNDLLKSITDFEKSYSKILQSTRRHLLIKLLPSFTHDSGLMVSIINEIEDFFLLLENITLKEFIQEQTESFKKIEFLYAIINNSIDGIAAFNKNLQVIEWNHVLEKHHGFKKEEILGKKIFEVLPEYKGSQEDQSISRVLNGEKVFFSNKPYLTKETGWYEVYMAPLYGKNEITGILCVWRDITQRRINDETLKLQQLKLEQAYDELKEHREELETANEELQENLTLLIAAQESLKENEARLVEAQAVAQLGSWEYDIENNKIFWSDELKRIFGFHPDDQSFDYQTYLSLLHPDDREMVNNHIGKTFETFEFYSFEHRIIKNGGEVRWIQAHGKPMVSDNKIKVLKGTALDITERKIAEEKLREEQFFIKKITDTTPNVITVFDLLEYKNLYYNREIHELLGYSVEQFNEMKKDKNYLKILLHPDDLKAFTDYIESYKLYLKNEPREIEYRIKDIKGNFKWILARHNVFKKSPKGFPIQIIGVLQDITEKKESEIRLLERESKLKESQSLAKLGHWELDLKTKNITWSEGLYQIYGLDFGLPIDLDFVRPLIVPNDYDNLIREIQKATRTNQPYEIEYRIKHPHLGIRTLYSRGNPVSNEENEVEKLKGITQDVTERKKIEKELEESQKFINAITESVPNIIFVYDVLNNKRLYTNRDVASSLGYSGSEKDSLGDNLLRKLVHTDDFHKLILRNQKVISAKADDTFEVYFRIKHANGDWRWLRSLSKIFNYNSEGLPWQILGITEDVTEKKRAEENLQKAYLDMQNMNQELVHAKEQLKNANNELELRVEKRTKELSGIILQLKKSAEEQQKFSTLVEKSINFISMADLEGNIIYINEGGLKLVGLESKEKALQTKINDYFFEKDLPIINKKPYEEEAYTNHWKGEFTFRHFQTGEAIPVFSYAFRIEDPVTGKILALANVSHDLTDQKRKEEEIKSSRKKLESINLELNKKNEELLKINIDLDNFVYTASHDLKSPISNLEGLLLAINKPMEQKLNEQEKQIFIMMHRSIYKLKDTINALVEITKAQRNLEESKEIVSIPEVLEEVKLEIEKSILESKATIIQDLEVENILYAKINLHSIIYNLLSNAIKYRDIKRPLKINIHTFKEENETVVLTIKDNGLGIQQKQQAKLFGMFRRFHSHVEGTGIGLYIIKRVVENNNGRIEMESEEGKGTCFKVYFYA